MNSLDHQSELDSYLNNHATKVNPVITTLGVSKERNLSSEYGYMDENRSDNLRRHQSNESLEDAYSAADLKPSDEKVP